MHVQLAPSEGSGDSGLGEGLGGGGDGGLGRALAAGVTSLLVEPASALSMSRRLSRRSE